MNERRAYTRIDPGIARVGNTWFERTWSTFIGDTIELQHKSRGIEWTAGKSLEFHLEVDGEALGVMELGEREWSEACNPFGAGLVARYGGDKLALVIGTLALHTNPGMLRTAHIMNRSETPVRVNAVATEALALRREDVRVYTQDFQREQVAVAWETSESTAALLHGDGGLVLGMQGGGRFELFAPDGTQCVLRALEEKTLAPGEHWRLPDTFVLPFSCSLKDCQEQVLPDFLLQVGHMWRWEAEVRAEQRAASDAAGQAAGNN